MPKRKSFYQTQTEERLKDVKPLEFALDGPQKVKQITIRSIHQTLTLRFRFIKFFKETGIARFSISQSRSTHASKIFITRRIHLFHRDSYELDQFIVVQQ